MENFVIYYLLFYYWLFLCGLCASVALTIYYLLFSILLLCVLGASVAQTTVLIGVNPCLTESYLKKQSQFGCFTAENAEGAEVFDV